MVGQSFLLLSVNTKEDSLSGYEVYQYHVFVDTEEFAIIILLETVKRIKCITTITVSGCLEYL